MTAMARALLVTAAFLEMSDDSSVNEDDAVRALESMAAELELECLRIPHFYRAFYVYKYATGLSAAIALSERVTTGGQKELNDYLGFLKGGSSKYPLDLLRDAGVDMETPGPVNAAMQRFSELVEELDELV